MLLIVCGKTLQILAILHLFFWQSITPFMERKLSGYTVQAPER